MTAHGHNSGGAAVKMHDAATKAWGRKWHFLAVFGLVFVTSTSVMAALDLLPESGGEKVVETSQPSLAAGASLAIEKPELPKKIEIPSIDLEVEVLNPTSTSVAVLDKALLEGVVRYPSSSKLGETGNVIIFGHSSFLPIVRNPNYKAFNNIENLKEGDRILVTGEKRTFVYEVESVKSADAEQDAIPLDVSGSKLTLATCDSFGEKSDRFIVTANLVESYPAAN